MEEGSDTEEMASSEENIAPFWSWTDRYPVNMFYSSGKVILQLFLKVSDFGNSEIKHVPLT